MKIDPKAKLRPWIKQAADFGPLLLFALVYWQFGLMPAIISLIVATIVALGVLYAVERRIAPLPLFSAVAVTVFGGLSLWLQDETFIKMKPTVLFAVFAAALAGGLILGRNPLKLILGQAIDLTDRGWKILSTRYTIFFASLAAVNEVIWRNFDTDFWVTFKVFGILGLTILFAVSQVPLMIRHSAEKEQRGPV